MYQGQSESGNTRMGPEGKIIIFSGEIGAGKSTVCSQLASYFRRAGWQVRGLITRGIFTNNQKKVIEAVNLENDESRLLAVYRSQPITDKDANLPLHWDFDPQALEWGNQVFRQAVVTDLFIVDELGPLEMKLNQGWIAAIELLDGRAYRLALVVVRPALLTQAIKRWPWAHVITLNEVAEIPEVMKTVLQDWNIGFT